MKFKLIAICIIIIANFSIAFTQDFKQLIVGDWILKDQINPLGTQYNVYNVRLCFSDNDKCRRKLDAYSKSEELNYRIKTKRLELGVVTFTIDIISANKMILLDVKDPRYKYIYVKPTIPSLNKNNILDYHPAPIRIVYNKFSKISGRGMVNTCISQENFTLKTPEFAGDKDFTKYLLEKLYYTSRYFKKSTKRLIDISFEITKTGIIENISVKEENGDEWLEKKILKLFKSKSNKWAPLIYENKYYKSKINFSLILEKIE